MYIISVKNLFWLFNRSHKMKMWANEFSLFMQEKERTLNLTVDVFCRLVKQRANVAQIITMYVNNSLFSDLLPWFSCLSLFSTYIPVPDFLVILCTFLTFIIDLKRYHNVIF